MRWWRDRHAVGRFVCDLVASEARRIAPGRRLPPLPWPDTLDLGESGVGADSLDRLKLATALGEAIHLQQSNIEDTLLTRTTVGEWIDTTCRSLTGYHGAVTFQTSGSTGEPKWCVHALTDLLAEIDVLAAAFSNVRRVVAAVPSHHIYGFLWTVLLPVRLNAGVIDVRGTSAAGLGALLADGDLVVGHPDFWAGFAAGVAPLTADVRGVTSTAPCSAAVARTVVARGVGSLTEVYGSSETAGIGMRRDPSEAYALLPYWRRGGGDDLVRRSPDGSERTLRAPDLLTWDDARHVRPAGRREGAVQVGGTNVLPEKIGALLRGHPAIADAAVRLMQPAEGNRLKAYIVPHDRTIDESVLRATLFAWSDLYLTPPERPRSFSFGPALPTGELGKLADWPADRTLLDD